MRSSTTFAFTGKRDTPGTSSGSILGLPRLPPLTKSTWLEIPVYIEELDFHADAFKIEEVTYDPIHRHQEVTLLVHGLTEELQRQLAHAIYASLHNFNAVLWEMGEETMMFEAKVRELRQLLKQYVPEVSPECKEALTRAKPTRKSRP